MVPDKIPYSITGLTSHDEFKYIQQQISIKPTLWILHGMVTNIK